MNWGKAVVLVLALFMAFIIYMVVQMFGANVDLVEEDYYQQEVNYEQRRTALKNSLEFKEYVEIQINKDALKVVFPEELDMSKAEGIMHLYNVQAASKDVKLPITSKYGNEQPFMIDENMHGAHIVKILFNLDSKDYYFEKRITL